MTISQDDVGQILSLARLKVSAEETQRFTQDLVNILVHVDTLRQVDVSNVKAMTHAVPAQLPTRSDEVQDSLGSRGLEGSAGKEGRFVRVPKIME